MTDPAIVRTVKVMTAIAIPGKPALIVTARRHPNRPPRIWPRRHLLAVIVLPIAAFLVVLTVNRPGPSAPRGPVAAIQQHPGPPSSEEALAGQGR